jgi:hypothetical protein
MYNGIATNNEAGCNSNVGWARVRLAHQSSDAASSGGQRYRSCPQGNLVVASGGAVQ